jgi:alkanesulfonate monooxygenase SsuD/methylene tetrahydromethanopterin reductase-like flavin-dependent oxidoreductase (luciferase family)
MSYDDLLQRARWCEEVGIDSFWLMDHLYPPGLPGVPSLEAWTLAAALLANTSALQVGHMVSCANFRSPALTGKMATTLDVVSGGRFVLGLGSGSVEVEHRQAGLPWGTFAERTDRLEETLEIVTRMFTGEATTFEGRQFSVHDLPNLPPPTTPGGPPILVGGTGARTLGLAARFASIWNCPTYGLADRAALFSRLRQACDAAGRDPAEIKVSTESVLVLVRDDADLPEAMAKAERRYGMGFGLEDGFVGTPARVAEALAQEVAQGVRHFVFFVYDRAARDTLDLLGNEVIPAVRKAAGA